MRETRERWRCFGRRRKHLFRSLWGSKQGPKANPSLTCVREVRQTRAKREPAGSPALHKAKAKADSSLARRCLRLTSRLHAFGFISRRSLRAGKKFECSFGSLAVFSIGADACGKAN